MAHHHGSTAVGWLAVPLLAALAVGYLFLAGLARRRNPARGWSRWRSAWFVVGLLLVAAALLPPLEPLARTDVRIHMVQHLLIGAYAPLALVLAAPATLLLRTLHPSRARRLTAVLHSPALRPLVHPATGLLLSTGSLAALYFTPVYGAVTGSEAGHWLLHAHFLLSGCLFAYAIAGPDPAPRRPSVPARLTYLGLAVAGHAVMAQLMYGGFWIRIDAPAAELRAAAELMYYGGDIAELLLAVALVSTWRPRRGPRPVTRPVGRAVTRR